MLKEKICDVYINKNLLAFFEKRNTFENHQALNDAIIISHITEWVDSKDKVLSDLCNRFMSRTKFKVLDLNFKKVSISKIKKEVSKKYDINYYFEHVKIPITIIQTPIYVEIDGKLKKLEEVSELIKFYNKQNWDVEFVIYPRDVEV
jgi:HD superfamily phosphohydrolase